MRSGKKGKKSPKGQPTGQKGRLASQTYSSNLDTNNQGYNPSFSRIPSYNPFLPTERILGYDYQRYPATTRINKHATSFGLQNIPSASNFSNNYYKKVKWVRNEPVIKPIRAKQTVNTSIQNYKRNPNPNLQENSSKVSTLQKLKRLIAKDKTEETIPTRKLPKYDNSPYSITEVQEDQRKTGTFVVSRTILNEKIICAEQQSKEIDAPDLIGASKLRCEFAEQYAASLKSQCNIHVNDPKYVHLKSESLSVSIGSLDIPHNVFASGDIIQRNVAVDIWRNKFLKKDTSSFEEQISTVRANHWDEMVELKTNLFVHRLAIFRRKLITVIRQGLDKSDSEHLINRFDLGAEIPPLSKEPYEALKEIPEIDCYRDKIMGEVIEKPYEEDSMNYQKKISPWNKKFWKNAIKAFKLFGKDFKRSSDYLGVSCSIITQFYYDQEMELLQCFPVYEPVDEEGYYYPEEDE